MPVRKRKRSVSHEVNFDEGLPDRSDEAVKEVLSKRTRVKVAKKAPLESEIPTVGNPDSGTTGVSLEKFLKTPENVPSVLTWESVRKGELPKKNGKIVSGLPTSLENDVPPEFRFWKCDSESDALLVREALVESELFSKDTIRKVDGELRRVTVETIAKVYLSEDYDDGLPPVVPVKKTAIEKAALLLEDRDNTTLFSEQIVELMGLESVLEKVSSSDSNWLIGIRDTDEIKKSLNGPAFRLRSQSDVIFVSNVPLVDPDKVEWLQDRTTSVLNKALSVDHEVKLVKSDDEQRIVFGIVLEPEVVDAQNDIISKNEIEAACHRFMEHYGNLGEQHQEIVNGKLKILECFIAPTDFRVGKQAVKEGTWLLKERVVDDKLWERVKKGEFTGYSIGGSGLRKPEKG